MLEIRQWSSKGPADVRLSFTIREANDVWKIQDIRRPDSIWMTYGPNLMESYGNVILKARLIFIME